MEKIGIASHHGGYVLKVPTDGNPGLVVALVDQGQTANPRDFSELISDPDNYDQDGQRFSDWRMPTKEELDLIYEARKDIPDLNLKTAYWSGTPSGSFDTYWYMVIPANGVWAEKGITSGSFPYQVRAVRDLK